MLDIACGMFLEHGYGDTSLSMIAARIGGSKTTLYSYFPSKEALFKSVVEYKCRQWANVVLHLVSDEGALPETLRAYGARMLEVVLSDEFLAFHRLVSGEAARFPEIGGIYYEACIRYGLSHVASLLAEAMDAGLLDRSDPMIAAETLTDLYQSGLFRRRKFGAAPNPSPADVRAHVARATDLFLRAYGRPAANPAEAGAASGEVC